MKSSYAPKLPPPSSGMAEANAPVHPVEHGPLVAGPARDDEAGKVTSDVVGEELWALRASIVVLALDTRHAFVRDHAGRLHQLSRPLFDLLTGFGRPTSLGVHVRVYAEPRRRRALQALHVLIAKGLLVATPVQPSAVELEMIVARQRHLIDVLRRASLRGAPAREGQTTS